MVSAGILASRPFKTNEAVSVVVDAPLKVKANADFRRHELATLAAARALRSSYCCLAHGQVLAEQFYDAETVARLPVGKRARAALRAGRGAGAGWPGPREQETGRRPQAHLPRAGLRSPGAPHTAGAPPSARSRAEGAS